MTVESHFAELADSWAARYQQRQSFRQRLLAVEAVVGPRLRASDVVVDFGSGAGVFSALVSGRVRRVVSVDGSEQMLRAAARDRATLDHIVQEIGATHAPERVFRVAGTRQCFSARPTADLVLAVAVLEYVDDLTAHIAALAALLHPGGLLLITYPNTKSWVRRVERPVDAISTRLGRLVGVRRLAGREYSRLRPRPESDLGKQLLEAGLIIEARRGLPLAAKGWRSHLLPNELWLAVAPGPGGEQTAPSSV